MSHDPSTRTESLEGTAPEHVIVKNALAAFLGRAGRAPTPGRLGALVLAVPLGVLGCGVLGCERRAQRSEAPIETTTGSVKPTPKSAVPALDVSLAYPNVEAVGATQRIHWEKTLAVDAHSPPDAWKISFDASGDFAGICWKNKPGNEGQVPGDDLSKGGYRRISFWARGAAGGELVEFRAGGLGNVKTRYSDSFDVTGGRLRLTPGWKEYGIYVSNADLSSVMTPFCVLLHREDNPGAALIYLDDIAYRG
ncbi:MAG TPA: hypothetical protein VNN80_11200 [Polyangiaceae bacterium]|nr:hypothetical protein [Polyangiaceae bacterium]